MILKIVCIIVIGGILVFHVYSLDGIHGWFLSLLLEEDTEYSSGYSDRAFRQIMRGMLKQDVVKKLGIPLKEFWKYQARGKEIWIHFQENTVYYKTDYGTENFGKIREGMYKKEVLDILGIPIQESWIYTRSPGDINYRIRVIILKNNEVVEKIHEFYVD